MDCRTAQSLINSYIDRSLTMEQLEQFLKHVEHCPSCYDELEINFIVYYALQRLDDDDGKEGTFDMHGLLQEDIRRRRRRVRHSRIKESFLVAAIILAGFLVVLELLETFGILLM